MKVPLSDFFPKSVPSFVQVLFQVDKLDKLNYLKNSTLDLKNSFCFEFLLISSNAGRQNLKVPFFLGFNLMKKQCVHFAQEPKYISISLLHYTKALLCQTFMGCQTLFTASFYSQMNKNIYIEFFVCVCYLAFCYILPRNCVHDLNLAQ